MFLPLRLGNHVRDAGKDHGFGNAPSAAEEHDCAGAPDCSEGDVVPFPAYEEVACLGEEEADDAEGEDRDAADFVGEHAQGESHEGTYLHFELASYLSPLTCSFVAWVCWESVGKMDDVLPIVEDTEDPTSTMLSSLCTARSWHSSSGSSSSDDRPRWCLQMMSCQSFMYG